MSVTELLPHRPPFLFIDEVIAIDGDRLTARRTVRADEPHFAGHYPGRPIMPGVLLCEAALQAGCYLIASRTEGGIDALGSGVPVVTRMNEVKFKRMVRPGDVLEIEVQLERTLMGVHWFKATVKTDSKLAASLTFAVTVAHEAGAER